MLRIYKDNDLKIVTRGAYESFYKPLGYKQIIESTVVVEKKSEVKSDTKSTRVNSDKKNKKDASEK